MRSTGPQSDWPDEMAGSGTASKSGSQQPLPVPTSNRLLAPGGIDARQVWLLLREQRWFVFIVGAVVFALVMGFTLMSGMKFQAVGRLYLGELDFNRYQQLRTEDFLEAEHGDVYSEIEIVRSQSRVEEAILRSGLNVTVSPEAEQVLPYWRWRWSMRDPALLDARAVITASHTLLTSRGQRTEAFWLRFSEATSYIVYTEQGTELGRCSLGLPCETSRARLLLSAGAHGGPQPGAAYRMEIKPLAATVEDAMRQLQVTAPKVPTASEPVKVLTLEFEDPSPHKAAAFLQQLMGVYLEARLAWKTEDASAAESFVTKQLEGVQRSLGATEDRLAEFRAKNQAVVQASQSEAVVEQLAEFEQQRIAARMQLRALRDVAQALQRPDPSVESYMVGEVEDAVLTQLATVLLESQQTLRELKSRLYEGAPEYSAQKTKVATQLDMTRNYVATRLTRAQEQVNAFDGIIKQYESKLQAVPGAELGLAKIGRESEVYSRIYSYLLERQQQTQILKASTVSKNRVLDMPQVPMREHSPKLALRGASALLGLLLGALLVVVRALWSSALRTELEVRAALGPLPIFANVPPQAAPTGRTARLAAAPLFDVLSHTTERLGFAEAFRTLRTEIYDAQPFTGAKTITVTSPSPGDGKTTTALALATMLAVDRKRVLVIDCDVRKPSHHTLTGHPASPGLAELIAGECTEAEATYQVHVTGGSFQSIPAGDDAPVEVLSSAELSALLLQLRQRYDYVILDAASYPLVSDALVLARHSEFLLSVVRIGSTPRKLAEEHSRGLVGKSATHALVINDSEVAMIYGYPGYARAGASNHVPRPSRSRRPPTAGTQLQ